MQAVVTLPEMEAFVASLSPSDAAQLEAGGLCKPLPKPKSLVEAVVEAWAKQHLQPEGGARVPHEAVYKRWLETRPLSLDVTANKFTRALHAAGLVSHKSHGISFIINVTLKVG